MCKINFGGIYNKQWGLLIVVEKFCVAVIQRLKIINFNTLLEVVTSV